MPAHGNRASGFNVLSTLQGPVAATSNMRREETASTEMFSKFSRLVVPLSIEPLPSAPGDYDVDILGVGQVVVAALFQGIKAAP
ncbi:MAG: hypothetical protein Q7T63_04140 [Burkholderiaceae bacterium]|nr:hypothetical protein [Burkholderiaceae bacterium]